MSPSSALPDGAFVPRRDEFSVTLFLFGGFSRVYGQGDAVIDCDASEPPQGEPLYVRLVEVGRIVDRASFQNQAARAYRTWDAYKRVELSPAIHRYQEQFRAKQDQEIASAPDRWRLQ